LQLGTEPSIYSYLNSATFPKLLSKEVKLHDISYKLYYLVLREGGGNSLTLMVYLRHIKEYLSRTKVADVETFELLSLKKVKIHSSLIYPSTIVGWGESFPKFKVVRIHLILMEPFRINFGAGVFYTIRLGYFSQGQGIPAYAPLIFSIKLYEINRLDSDDGILNFKKI
jgi:hypothetical protein